MGQKRILLVIADDFGFGPATSRGILDLAVGGPVTGSVLMVNSPFAESAVEAWHKLGCPMELGWHPSLTSDGPVLPPEQVPSLVNEQGKFYPLGRFIKRLFLNQIAASEIAAEMQAQLRRFAALVGHPPRLVNSHQHVALFQPVGFILMDLLRRLRPLPYMRRIREPLSMLLRIPGARCKRGFLSFLGRPLAREQMAWGFPGSDWLAGITDPPWVKDPHFFARWLQRIPGAVVELACHPGYHDPTLIGRDCTGTDGLLQRRVDELALLTHPSFAEVCATAGFIRLRPAEWINRQGELSAHAA